MKVKDFVTMLQKEYKGDDEILFIWWEKSLCREWVDETIDELSKENELTSEQADEMFNNAWEFVANDTYETGEIGEAITFSLKESFTEWLNDHNKEIDDTKLWKE